MVDISKDVEYLLIYNLMDCRMCGVILVKDTGYIDKHVANI